ncbi:MAG: heparinase II/III family protein [Kiritimatiellia bacterium]
MKIRYFTLLCLVLCCAIHLWADAPANGMPEGPTYGWVTEKRYANLRAHPRLFVSQEQLQRAVAGRGAEFAALYETVAASAAEALADGEDVLAGQTVWRRAILIQNRVMSLVVQWHRTGDRRYLDAVLRDTEIVSAWASKRAIGLPEGQFATVIAIVYDLLYDDLSPEQRERLVELARENFLLPFLRWTAPRDEEERIPGERRSWWQDNVSNWNPVSSSGNGVLALAMYEQIPEAQTVIDRVNSTYQVILEYVAETAGGWVEGLGYWNWSMQYMAQFFMSYERTTGNKHEGFRSEGFRKALTFGTYFVPHGEACGFGNNQHGNFSSHLAAALEHLEDREGFLRVMEHFVAQDQAGRNRAERVAAQAGEPAGWQRGGGPFELLLMPDVPDTMPEPRKNKIHTFPNQGWSMLADQWPNPNVYAAVRGGQLGGHHTHQDLLSWHGVVGIERMIINITGSDYYNTAWAGRAHEIYEKGSASKNTLFIGGLSAYSGSRGGRMAEAHATHFQLSTGPVLRLDATRAFWLTRAEPTLVCRVFHVVENKGLLVLDRVIARGAQPVEARAFTVKDAVFGERDVLLTGAFETARMTFASDVPAVLRRATGVLTDGHREPPTMIRWQTLGQASAVTFATLLTRGPEPVVLELETSTDAVIVEIASGDWSQRIPFTGTLQKVAPVE